MQNTSTIALGVLFAPITVLFGPIAAFNAACIVGPPLSALAAFFWLRRHFTATPAAIGGLVFGFSAFVVDRGSAGHIVLTWLFPDGRDELTADHVGVFLLAMSHDWISSIFLSQATRLLQRAPDAYRGGVAIWYLHPDRTS